MDQHQAGLRAFLDGMIRADPEAMAAQLADDVVLNSPLAADPVVGRAAVLGLLTRIGRLADELTVEEILIGPDHLAAVFRQRIGAVTVSGVDYVRFTAEGRIAELTAFWRPLPAILAMRDQLTQ